MKPVDNRLAAHLGYHPQDNTEAFRADVEAQTAAAATPRPRLSQHLGGWFVDLGHPDDEAREMK